MMVHYYYVDHSKTSSAQSEASDRGNNQQSSFSCSSEILHGNFFLFGQAVWIICQLLGKIYMKYINAIFNNIKTYHYQVRMIWRDTYWSDKS
jgi:hypothetical protein